MAVAKTVAVLVGAYLADPSDAEGIVQITVTGQKNLCLDVYQGKAVKGAAVDIWTCGGVKGQQWYFDPGTFKIRTALKETLCVDAGNMKPGTALTLQDCDLSNNQFWGFDGTIFLPQSTADASMCMDVQGAAFKDGSPVQAYSCNGHTSQQWTVGTWVPPPKPFKINLAGQNLCLDLYGQKTTNGNPIDVWDCSDGVKGQQWFFVPGSYKIQSALDPSKCIDASDMKVRTHLQIWDCDGKPQQKWGYNQQTGGIYLVGAGAQNGAGNCMCLTDYKSGAPLQMFTCNGQATEKWTLTEIKSEELDIADEFLV